MLNSSEMTWHKVSTLHLLLYLSSMTRSITMRSMHTRSYMLSCSLWSSHQMMQPQESTNLHQIHSLLMGHLHLRFCSLKCHHFCIAKMGTTKQTRFLIPPTKTFELCSNTKRFIRQIFDSFKTGQDINWQDHEICHLPDMAYLQAHKYLIGNI